MPRASRALRLAVPAQVLVVAGCVLVAAGLAGAYAVRATAWAVMTDELQVAKLAPSAAEGLSPVPRIHGVYYGALSQLYPLLLAPFYGTLDPPAAAAAAHALNAFLLARSVTGSRLAGCVAAALTAFTPWLALAPTLLTENAAYPAFVWAVFLCHRALARPGRDRDAAALAGLLLAFFARTQLVVLALALPAALVLHEIGYALRTKPAPRRAALRAGVARIFKGHRVLTVAPPPSAVPRSRSPVHCTTSSGTTRRRSKASSCRPASGARLPPISARSRSGWACSRSHSPRPGR